MSKDAAERKRVALLECLRLGGYTCLSCGKRVEAGHDHVCLVVEERERVKAQETLMKKQRRLE